MSEITKESIREIVGMALANQEIRVSNINGGTATPIAVIGGQLRDLSEFRPANPDRKRVAVTLYSVESFIEYINEHKSAHTRIFADMHEAPYCMTAAIDYHEITPEGKPEFITHRALLELQTTDEWNRWFGKDKSAFNQISFAEFIEDNALDIIDPSSADIMEMCLTLQANNDVRWKSAAKLHNGAVHLEFKDDANVTAGKDGKMELPEMFKLHLAVFRGLDPQTIEARFRYRLNSGNITLFYQLVRPHKLIDAMVSDAMDKVKKETELPVFDGKFE